MDRAEIGLDGARCGASVTEIVPIGNASTLSDILIPLHVDLSMKVAFVASTPIMSYQGGHIPSNVYWAGHAPPPNAYARQDPRQMPPHPAQNPGSQYQPMSNRNEQHWNQNGPVQIQNGYSVNPGYANNNYQQPQIPPPQAHVQGPTQYISPAQLFQSQPQQQYQYQRSNNGDACSSGSASRQVHATSLSRGRVFSSCAYIGPLCYCFDVTCGCWFIREVGCYRTWVLGHSVEKCEASVENGSKHPATICRCSL